MARAPRCWLLLTQSNAVTGSCLLPGPILPFRLAIAMNTNISTWVPNLGAGLQVWSQYAHPQLHVWAKDLHCPSGTGAVRDAILPVKFGLIDEQNLRPALVHPAQRRLAHGSRTCPCLCCLRRKARGAAQTHLVTVAQRLVRANVVTFSLPCTFLACWHQMHTVMWCT